MTLKMKLMSVGVAVALSACSTALEPAADAAPEQPPATEAPEAEGPREDVAEQPEPRDGETGELSTVEQPDCRVPSPPIVVC
jgi:hypothetical protein